MKLLHRLSGLTALIAALCLSACTPKPEIASVNKGVTFYTQTNLRFEEKLHLTTNYQVGFLIPVNTEVTVEDTGSKSIVIDTKDGRRLKIENVEEYSGETIVGIFNRSFGKTKVDLSKFTKKEQGAIAGDSVEPGMSKEAVIVAVGYPPKHKTPTLAGNAWRYWHNRFNTFTVHFKDGKVANIEE